LLFVSANDGSSEGKSVKSSTKEVCYSGVRKTKNSWYGAEIRDPWRKAYMARNF